MRRRRCGLCGRPWWVIGERTGVGCLCHGLAYKREKSADIQPFPREPTRYEECTPPIGYGGWGWLADQQREES